MASFKVLFHNFYGGMEEYDGFFTLFRIVSVWDEISVWDIMNVKH